MCAKERWLSPTARTRSPPGRATSPAHGKSAYQVLLRWHLQCGTIAIPGSSNAAHIAEDYDIFDFELTPDEMQRINALECNHRFASY